MTSNEDLHQELMEIKSQLVGIDGKVLLSARAQKGALLAVLEGAVASRPLKGRIYLDLDEPRTQLDLVERLSSSAASVSRQVNDMHDNYGIVIPVDIQGRGNYWQRDPMMERVLNLSHHVSRWLEE